MTSDVDLLTESEKSQAVLEILPAMLPIGRAPRWDDLLPAEKQAATATILRKRQTPAAVTPPAPGVVTHSELMAAFEQFATAASEPIYEVVDERISPIEERVRGLEAAMQSRSDLDARPGSAATKMFLTIEQRIARVEEKIGGDGGDREALKSLQRQVSRHSEHLANLESKLGKLKRGDE